MDEKIAEKRQEFIEIYEETFTKFPCTIKQPTRRAIWYEFIDPLDRGIRDKVFIAVRKLNEDDRYKPRLKVFYKAKEDILRELEQSRREQDFSHTCELCHDGILSFLAARTKQENTTYYTYFIGKTDKGKLYWWSIPCTCHRGKKKELKWQRFSRSLQVAAEQWLKFSVPSEVARFSAETGGGIIEYFTHLEREAHRKAIEADNGIRIEQTEARRIWDDEQQWKKARAARADGGRYKAVQFKREFV